MLAPWKSKALVAKVNGAITQFTKYLRDGDLTGKQMRILLPVTDPAVDSLSALPSKSLR